MKHGWLRFLFNLDGGFWKAFGIIAAALGVGFGTYTLFVEDKRPTLQYEIVTNTSVLSVREEVADLSIMFEGTDITKQDLSLSVMTIRVVNPSSRDILQTFYTNEAPLGMALTSGRLIRPEVVDASNIYLVQHVNIQSASESQINFTPVIFEASQWFLLKVLVLHKNDELPSIRPTGKVAGVQAVTVRKLYLENDDDSFLERTFSGSFGVQLARLPSYFMLFFVGLGMIGGIAAGFAMVIDRIISKKIVQHYKRYVRRELSEKDFEFLRKFIDSPFIVQEAYELIENSDYRGKMLKLAAQPPEEREREDHWLDEMVTRLLDSGLIMKGEKGELICDNDLANTIKDFYVFLKNNGYEKKLGRPRFLRTYVFTDAHEEDKPATI